MSCNSYVIKININNEKKKKINKHKITQNDDHNIN